MTRLTRLSGVSGVSGVIASDPSNGETTGIFSLKERLENKKIYDKLKIKWQEAYEVQLKLVDDNITTSMWKALGL